jgi:hypothetical protein
MFIVTDNIQLMVILLPCVAHRLLIKFLMENIKVALYSHFLITEPFRPAIGDFISSDSNESDRLIQGQFR